jgi:predicted RNA-binding Zn-ribbon protein involved in translation (DUF1610 family)
MTKIHTETDWQRGEPCPDCGSEEIHVMRESGEVFRSTDGEWEYHSKTDTMGAMHKPECNNCGKEL